MPAYMSKHSLLLALGQTLQSAISACQIRQAADTKFVWRSPIRIAVKCSSSCNMLSRMRADHSRTEHNKWLHLECHQGPVSHCFETETLLALPRGCGTRVVPERL